MEEPSDELINIGLSKGCDYMFAYQKLFVGFVSINVVYFSQFIINKITQILYIKSMIN